MEINAQTFAPWTNVEPWGHTAYKWGGHIGNLECGIIVYGPNGASPHQSDEAKRVANAEYMRRLLDHLQRLGIISLPLPEAAAAHAADCPQRARIAYYARHPNACRVCNVTGIVTSTENGALHGAGFWPMPVVDPCPGCTAQGKCPRCAADLPGEELDTVVCAGCGWMAGSADTPPDRACTCQRGGQPDAHP